MLRRTIIIGLVLMLVQISFGQDVFRKGKTGINLGAGYKTIGAPAFGGNLSIERSVLRSKKLGYLGLGLHSEVLLAEEIIPTASFRVIIHPKFFRTKIWDVYTGTGLVYAEKETLTGTNLHLDVFLGFRYKLGKSNFGLFSELSLYGANFEGGICFIW